MAVIADQVPPPAPLPADFKARVVVKFRPDVRLSYTGAAVDALTKQPGRNWGELTAAFPGVALAPYFASIGEATLQELAKRAPRIESAGPPPQFTSYYAVECPRGIDPAQVATVLGTWPNVEIAYVEGGPTPPPLNPSDDPRNANQGYLDAAPGGIDARWVWSGVDGSGIGFVDMERGWTLNHEDLAAAGIAVISGVSQDYHGHGTAVLGEVLGVDNTVGGVGIAPGATGRVVSQWRTASTYNTADAILSAVAAMNAGDVLLLEAQTSYPTVSGFVPVEVEQAVFDAIQFATSHGIVVVEAGANGSADLDAFQTLSGKKILNRGSADFRDSGAIMVGAASSAAPHQRLSFSNYGSRIDCYAWGQNIDTCGDGWTGNATNTYTPSFGGTSGASPIVAGAALLMQAWSVGAGRGRYSPGALRGLLSSAVLNTASANPGSDRIGVMPNLRAVIEAEIIRGIIDSNRWRAIIWILFGVINDASGVGIKPGGGPVPIDPWGPLVAHLAEEKQDMLAGLAVTEMSALLHNEASRRDLNKAGLGVIRRSLDRLVAQR
jgi:hypothetical protein